MKNWLETISSGKQASSLEFRTRPVNGSSRDLLRTGVLETDANGKPLRIIGTVQDITERKKSEETIYDLAYYDPLTHQPNRRLMLNRLKQALISSKLKSQYGAILFMDLNNFKMLNDTKGHDIGDLLLIEVSLRLNAAVHEDDTVARTGGNEFVVLLDGLDRTTDLAAAQAETVAKRLLASIGQPFDLRGYAYRCSASIGIVLFHSHEINVDELVKHATMAMHQAKQMGKNTIRFFDPAIQEALEFRVQLESWMHKALNEQYELYYQIQVDDKGNAIGAETLIRWHHPEKGMISPADFIPLAEETGLILPIGQWVLETACTQLKAWEHQQNTEHLVLAVNVSAKQFAQKDFVKQVLATLEKTGANPNRLKLELTESMLVTNIEDIIAKINSLKIKGVKFSLDDFGTGFSSLSYLKRLPLDQLKIDQSFVRDSLIDSSDAAIISAVITLGQSLGMDVIAEGVETEEQRNYLATQGCTHYQGYLFSKPLRLHEFETLLHNRFGSPKK
jgi:diguanylate cyclase (GGDEF)-like protein